MLINFSLLFWKICNNTFFFAIHHRKMFMIEFWKMSGKFFLPPPECRETINSFQKKIQRKYAEIEYKEIKLFFT